MTITTSHRKRGAQPSTYPILDTPDTWRRLEADLRSQHLPHEATPEASAIYGQKYAIRARLENPAGVSADAVSVWVIRTGEEFPRFVTAYPEGSR